MAKQTPARKAQKPGWSLTPLGIIAGFVGLTEAVLGLAVTQVNVFCFSRKWRDATSELYYNSGGLSPMRKPRKN